MYLGFIMGVNEWSRSIVIDTSFTAYHHEAKVETVKTTQGIASWYDYTLAGIEWSKTHSTCASRTAKRYSTITVENLDNGKKVDCFVNDWVENPKVIVDLSSHAFEQLAPLSKGLINVQIYEASK